MRLASLRARAVQLTCFSCVIGGMVLLSNAGAHVGGVGNGDSPTTDAPDLRSVQVITPVDLGDGLAEKAEYCFDQPVSNTGAAFGYFIQTYDANRLMDA